MVVWITGASSGIGEACAYRYASRGYSLILTSSSAERLATVAERCRSMGAAQVVIMPYDLRNASDMDPLVDEAWNCYGRVDILYCNAGVSQRTRVEDTSAEMIRTIMEVNFFAPAEMSRLILPRMIAAGGGHIAVTSSIAGYFGFPLRCAYSAAKHAVYGFFETLCAENAGKGIKVTVVCPGRVRTNISFNALDKGGKKHSRMDPGQEGGLSADKAARRIVRAIDRGRREVLVGRFELLMVWIKRFFPGLCAAAARRVNPV